ncbi:MAG: L,D-transpeptidase family protein [Actinomycetota bacterium]|nr:L,D-transpeptidase family protein [Actinomycetota bacterium]
MRKITGLIIAAAAFVVLLVALGRAHDPGRSRASELESSSSQDEFSGDDPGQTPPIKPTDPFPLPDPLVDPSVRIDKSLRMLTVFSEARPVKHYQVSLGTEPAGDKEAEGDGRTPEGEFYVCTKNSASQYHRSIGLSYPNAEDAERGLASKMISKREHRTIIEAMRHLKQPPWNTALGGEIMIHGGGTRADWTAGCIAISDKDAEELYNALPLGTSVLIEP